ncbi:Uncharacterized protein TCM_017745 [Theobroma cacao]|uniref:Uncharacterized protein n=1 Tax=Theobroma cacao TaxID=3641 RepID=A0A061EFP4_THECC|nr:Uncharacterized protein TCM_017745 [Theobroma cacao]
MKRLDVEDEDDLTFHTLAHTRTSFLTVPLRIPTPSTLEETTLGGWGANCATVWIGGVGGVDYVSWLGLATHRGGKARTQGNGVRSTRWQVRQRLGAKDRAWLRLPPILSL